MSDYLTEIRNAKKFYFDEKHLKKVHYNFQNGKEMIEEYNMETVLARRAWKCNQGIKDNYEWDVEVEDNESSYGSKIIAIISESPNQPFVSRRNTRKNFEWRIRNLPYGIKTYSVTVNPEEKCLIVKTSNKKYYKKLKIPELSRLNLVPEEACVSVSHKFNTLFITYKKPKELLNIDKFTLEKERAMKDEVELHNVKTESLKCLLDLMQCRTLRWIILCRYRLEILLDVIALADYYLMTDLCMYLTEWIAKNLMKPQTVDAIYQWSIGSQRNLLRDESVAFTMVNRFGDNMRVTMLKQLSNLGYVKELAEDIYDLLARFVTMERYKTVKSPTVIPTIQLDFDC